MLYRSLACLVVAGVISPVAHSQPQTAPSQPAKPAASAAGSRSGDRAGDAYTLGTCPISGDKIGGMGDAVAKVYDGREVRFCCKSCVEDFEKDKAAAWAKIDEQMVKDQLPFYPLETSVVSGKALKTPVNYVWNNRLVRLADESEKAEFQKDTAKYIAALDKAVIEKQSASYALKNCPMMGDPIDAADHKNVVVANRLVEVCCAKCAGRVRQNPAKALAALAPAPGAK